MSKFTSADFGLPKATLQNLKDLFCQHQNLKSVIVYGSRAMGNFKPSSDIDITLVGAKLTVRDLLAIENQIDDLMMPYKVDLSLHHNIDNADLLEHIRVHGTVLYQNKD